MKTLLLLILALMTISSAEAVPLIKGVRSPGYEINPERKEFVLHTSGVITLATENFRGGEKTFSTLGQLSQKFMERVVEEVNGIDPNAALVDPREGEPICADMPAITISVFQNGMEKVIHSRADCHEKNVQDNRVPALVGFADLFLKL